MEFQILSHAGLAVRAAGFELLFDPWLIGSTYWRSWWNYPPPPEDVIRALRPDAIYLTHIHWDHFQAVTLVRFDPSTPVFIPRSPGRRLRRDLEAIGFRDVRELRHAEEVEIAPGFSLHSWHFSPFLDSAPVVVADGVTLLNANDAKLMGAPLRQLLARHPHIDFVLRSHSSANSRLCFEVIGHPQQNVDDGMHYVRDFASFARATGARWAVPFASNHCHLHEDVWHFNDQITTPLMVESYFREHAIDTPQLQVMLPGDSWSSEHGFRLTQSDYFSRRKERLEEYRATKVGALTRQAELEARAELDLPRIADYFRRLSRAVPLPVRLLFRNQRICYVLRAGLSTHVLSVDLARGAVELRRDFSDAENPIQIHTSLHVFQNCIESDLFSHLSISKRVRYRVTPASLRHLQLWNLLFNLYEYEWFPLRNILRPRVWAAWLPRWREVGLYARILVDLLRGRQFDLARYLPRPPEADSIPALAP